MEIYTLHFDGSCGPKNPGGTAAYGFAIEKAGETIEQGSGVIGSGPAMTNNLAEFCALAEGFMMFFKVNPDTSTLLNVIGDSRLVINMMNGKFKPSSDKRYYPGYVLANDALKELRRRGVKITFNWVPREQNSICDGLSKAHGK